MKRMKQLAALLLAGLMAAVLPGCTTDSSSGSGAGGENSSGQDTLVLGTSADYAPFEFHKIIDGKDTIVGFDIELARQIAEDMGKELVIKDMEFGNLITELNNGTIDMIISSLTPDAERAKQVDFSECYYYGEQVCIIRKADMEKYTSMESLAGQSVAAQLGSIYEGIVKDMMPDSNLVSLAKMPDIIMQLNTGKVEAVVVDRDSAEGYLAQDDTLAIADFTIPYDENGAAVAVKKGNSELLEQINETIQQVTSDGTMDQWIEEAKAMGDSSETE